MTLYLKCTYCRKEFEAKRTSAKYCSDTCRVKYNNLPKMVARDMQGILGRLDELDDILKKYPELSLEIDGALEEIRDYTTTIQFSINPLTLRTLQLAKTGSLIFECQECGQKVFDVGATMADCAFCGERRWKQYNPTT